MTTTVNGVKVGYTNAGNQYKKSNTGKKVATATCLGLAVASPFIPLKTLAKYHPSSLLRGKYAEASKYAKTPFDVFRQFVRGTYPGLKEAIKDIPEMLKSGNLNKAQKLLCKAASTKGGRAALIGGAIAISLAISVGIYRLIGGIYDKIVDKGAKAEADRRGALVKAQ